MVLHHDGHRITRLEPDGTEEVGHLIRTFVELAVGELDARAEHFQSDLVGRGLGVGSDMHAVERTDTVSHSANHPRRITRDEGR